MTSVIHKGLIINTNCPAGYAYVWIPTGNSTVPIGFSEYLYQNTGGQLHGGNLSDAIDSSYLCKIASPLTGGAWFHVPTGVGASVFDDYSDIAYDYRIFHNYQTHGNNGVPSNYVLPTDLPATTGSISVSTLSLTGGNQTHRVGTLPKGNFPILEENQWVLVGFISSETNPIIFASLHSDEAWNVVKS